MICLLVAAAAEESGDSCRSFTSSTDAETTVAPPPSFRSCCIGLDNGSGVAGRGALESLVAVLLLLFLMMMLLMLLLKESTDDVDLADRSDRFFEAIAFILLSLFDMALESSGLDGGLLCGVSSII